ncbi:unnamed protein product [Colias eurytheme]|nr:unnamed protein product [Colias eurytheme]
MYMYEQSQRPTKPRNPIGVRSSDAIARCCCGHEAMRQAAACCLVVALGITLYYVHVATDALRLGCTLLYSTFYKRPLLGKCVASFDSAPYRRPSAGRVNETFRFFVSLIRGATTRDQLFGIRTQRSAQPRSRPPRRRHLIERRGPQRAHSAGSRPPESRRDTLLLGRAAPTEPRDRTTARGEGTPRRRAARALSLALAAD